MNTARHELGVSEIGGGNTSRFDWSMRSSVIGGVGSEDAASVTSADHGLGHSIGIYNSANGNREDLAKNMYMVSKATILWIYR
jgi:hypothetical protein